MNIQPIDRQQQQQVLEKTQFYLQQAEGLFERHFEMIPVVFDLRGTSAGMYKVHGSRRWIRYNPWIFAKYFELSLEDTVPHEVAHYIVDEVYGRRAKPHGHQWQTLMAHFDADPGVTFNLDLTGIPQRKQTTYAYQCHCDVHQVSATRHNRVMRGKGSYLCKNCDGELVYCEGEVVSV